MANQTLLDSCAYNTGVSAKIEIILFFTHGTLF